MSNGALKLGNNQDLYVDAASHRVIPREWIEGQDYLKKRDDDLLTKGLGVPPTQIPQLNNIIGSAVSDIQDASFVPLEMLKLVASPDLAAFTSHPTLSQRPRGSTLSPSTLAATIYNISGDVVRKIIDLLDDAELKSKADAIKGDETDKTVSHPNIIFETVASYKDLLKQNELLSGEAKELLKLFGEGTVDAVRDFVRVIAESILARADLSYESLSSDVTHHRGIFENSEEEQPDVVKYSTLNPLDFVNMMMKYFEFGVIGIVSRLPDERKKIIYDHVLQAE